MYNVPEYEVSTGVGVSVQAKLCSKIDFSDVYEQIHVDPKDILKTVFAMVYGTYLSHTMQIGDCNAPITFQQVMNYIFWDYIGIFLHVYLDNLFIYSNLIEEHERHLKLVFKKIQEHEFYLKTEKCKLYADKVNCLGHVINKKGLHADSDKLSRIQEWRTPHNYNNVQKFLKLIQYLLQFLPDIIAYTGLLSLMVKNGQPFYW